MDQTINLYEIGQHVRVKSNICESDAQHCGWASDFKNYAGQIVEIVKSAQVGKFNAYEVKDLSGQLIDLTFENDCFEEGIVAQNVTYTVEYLEVIQGAVFKVSKKKKNIFSTEKEACDFILSIANQEKTYKNITMSMDKDITKASIVPPFFNLEFFTEPQQIEQEEEQEENCEYDPCDGCNGDDCSECEYGDGGSSPCDTNCEGDCEGCRYN